VPVLGQEKVAFSAIGLLFPGKIESGNGILRCGSRGSPVRDDERLCYTEYRAGKKCQGAEVG
jgi:hypothetical protein